MNDAEVSNGGPLVCVMVWTSVGGGEINLSALFMRSQQNKELPERSAVHSSGRSSPSLLALLVWMTCTYRCWSARRCRNAVMQKSRCLGNERLGLYIRHLTCRKMSDVKNNKPADYYVIKDQLAHVVFYVKILQKHNNTIPTVC